MQIILFIVVTIILVAFLIYKINKKFGKKEMIILALVVILPLFIGNFLMENSEHKVPDIFKKKYEKEKNVKILKLSFERLNNKNVSSNTNFIYDFNYIINKDDKEFVCNAKVVKIKKIQDEYVFENFDSLNEKCDAK